MCSVNDQQKRFPGLFVGAMTPPLQNNNAPPPNGTNADKTTPQNIFQYLNSAPQLPYNTVGNTNQGSNFLHPQIYQQLLANFLASYTNGVPNNRTAVGVTPALNNSNFNINNSLNGSFAMNGGGGQPQMYFQPQPTNPAPTVNQNMQYQAPDDGGNTSYPLPDSQSRLPDQTSHQNMTPQQIPQHQIQQQQLPQQQIQQQQIPQQQIQQQQVPQQQVPLQQQQASPDPVDFNEDWSSYFLDALSEDATEPTQTIAPSSQPLTTSNISASAPAIPVERKNEDNQTPPDTVDPQLSAAKLSHKKSSGREKEKDAHESAGTPGEAENVKDHLKGLMGLLDHNSRAPSFFDLSHVAGKQTTNPTSALKKSKKHSINSPDEAAPGPNASVRAPNCGRANTEVSAGRMDGQLTGLMGLLHSSAASGLFDLSEVSRQQNMFNKKILREKNEVESTDATEDNCNTAQSSSCQVEVPTARQEATPEVVPEKLTEAGGAYAAKILKRDREEKKKPHDHAKKKPKLSNVHEEKSGGAHDKKSDTSGQLEKFKNLNPFLLLQKIFQAYRRPSVVLDAMEVPDFFVGRSDENLSAYTNDVVACVKKNDVGALRDKLRRGHNFQCCNKFGESILHLACRRSLGSIVHFLISEVGISVRCRDDYGRTPLHDACWTSKPELESVRLLIEQEPDILRMKDKRGNTPLDYVKKEHWGVWCLFLKQNVRLLDPKRVRNP